ncbi:MAG: DEAD/DEAH box helicase [Oscillospiraceae bacterium]|nr:DEAD/DEAH box helicase [Oscillospiraceae bacterium]
MAVKKSDKAGNSSAEEKFVQIFCELFGPEKGQYVYLQYPFLDIYGKHRTIDYAVMTKDGKIAFEIDGETWHDPSKVSEEKYTDDLLKQNSMIYQDWKVYRWTDAQINKKPELVKDELITFLGTNPKLFLIEDNMPDQKGKVFELREHQEEALKNLAEMRINGETIALVQGATGSGKSAIGVLDAKSVGKRTLFIAHTKELVDQGAENFKKLWPEVTVGKYLGDEHDTDAFVICASVQSIIRNLDKFEPDDFGYLIIDECHHTASDSYMRLLGYFRPSSFTLGLTATPDRADGEDLLEIFKTMAHKLDIKDAVEQGVLAPVRCIRVKTNIDLSDVRINGFKYNSLDLENAVTVPGRNELIVNTYLEYVKNKPCVIFCTSVKHAETIAEMLRTNGVSAESVSGQTRNRKQILQDYKDRKISVLCACDLLNEGWDSPQTEVLFMARPTMSKTIYLQQLGRGMRTYKGKDHLMVFDFVDNANMFNSPYSLHRVLNLSQYVPGGLVLAQKHQIKWDQDMFRKGEKPDLLIDYPIHAIDYEIIDLFNWQEKAKDMISVTELVRRVSAQSETVEKYIRDGKIVADLEVPVGEKHFFRYFKPERVKEFCKEFKWKEIKPSNMKDMFMEMAKTMTMSYSYKPVFLEAFIRNMNIHGEALLEDVVFDFCDFYETRKLNGLPAEKKKCIFTEDNYSQKQAERLILSMPFRRFEDMGFMHHAKHLGTIRLDKNIKLNAGEMKKVLEWCRDGIERYFSE